MLSKLVFVLVVMTADGTAQRFATFETMEQCETFAQGFNSTRSHMGRASCLPENVRSAADVQQEFDTAMKMAMTMLDKMKKTFEQGVDNGKN